VRACLLATRSAAAPGGQPAPHGATPCNVTCAISAAVADTASDSSPLLALDVARLFVMRVHIRFTRLFPSKVRSAIRIHDEWRQLMRRATQGAIVDPGDNPAGERGRSGQPRTEDTRPQAPRLRQVVE